MLAINELLYYSSRRSAERLVSKLHEIDRTAQSDVDGVRSNYPGRYPEQSGALGALYRQAGSFARISAEFSTAVSDASVDSFAGKKPWLGDVIYELERAIEKAKEAM
jgi:hypothetical protein